MDTQVAETYCTDCICGGTPWRNTIHLGEYLQLSTLRRSRRRGFQTRIVHSPERFLDRGHDAVKIVPQLDDAHTRHPDVPYINVIAGKALSIDEGGLHGRAIGSKHGYVGLHLGLDGVFLGHERAGLVCWSL